MKKLEISFEEARKNIQTLLKEKTDYFQNVYNYDDIDETLGFYFAYIENGIILIPYDKVSNKEIVLKKKDISMMNIDDMVKVETTKTYYERKKEELEHILRYGKMEEEDTTYNELFDSLHSEGVSTESELAAHFGYYEIMLTPSGEHFGEIFMPLTDGVGVIPFSNSNLDNGFEQLEIDKVRIITKREKDEVKDILSYYESAIADLDFAISKQRLRTLTSGENI